MLLISILFFEFEKLPLRFLIFEKSGGDDPPQLMPIFLGKSLSLPFISEGQIGWVQYSWLAGILLQHFEYTKSISLLVCKVSAEKFAASLIGSLIYYLRLFFCCLQDLLFVFDL